MVEISPVQEVALDKDPQRIHQGLWLAMMYGNKIAKSKSLPDFESIVSEVHTRVIKPVVEPQYLYLLESYRTREALVLGGIVHPARWREIPQMMEEYKEHVEEEVDSIKKKRFPDVAKFIDLTSFAHYQFYKIHPFLDGHKRTARQIVDILSKHLGFESALITIGRKHKYMDAIGKSTESRDMRYFSIFQAGLLADTYRASMDSKGRYCFNAATDYRAHLIREIKLNSARPVLKSEMNAEEKLAVGKL